MKELLEKRAKCIADARAIISKAETEKRDPTVDERAGFDKFMNEAESLKTQVDTMLADEKRKSSLETAEKELETSRGRQAQLESDSRGTQKTGEKRVIELRKSICGDCRTVEVPVDTERRDSFRKFLSGQESRALQKDSDTGGGYLSAPLEYMAELIMAVDNLVFMRQICRVLPPLTTAESLGCPSLDNDPADPTWVSELAIGTEDSSMNFGKRELKPSILAQFIKVSKTLLRRSSIGADAIVRERLAYKCAVAMENAYLNGSGANQPLGIFTASDNGISTGQDVSSGNTPTEIRFDGLKEAQYTLKGQYRNKAAWVFNREAIKLISKLKDGEGRYIWEASVQAGQPDRILKMPIYESEYAPHVFTASQYVGALGDFSKYWIVDSLQMTIQVLLELYAATNQNGYLSRIESDGMPILEEAFVRVKLAAS
jgi:HK97 family phage major capsid protein